jgi:hypothetical protein
MVGRRRSINKGQPEGCDGRRQWLGVVVDRLLSSTRDMGPRREEGKLAKLHLVLRRASPLVFVGPQIIAGASAQPSPAQLFFAESWTIAAAKMRGPRKHCSELRFAKDTKTGAAALPTRIPTRSKSVGSGGGRIGLLRLRELRVLSRLRGSRMRCEV